MFRPAIVSIWSLALLTVTAIAQSPDIPEPASVEAIAAATTDPHFVSPWVSYVPQSNTVPSPEKFIGRIMGAPGELVGTEKTYDKSVEQLSPAALTIPTPEPATLGALAMGSGGGRSRQSLSLLLPNLGFLSQALRVPCFRPTVTRDRLLWQRLQPVLCWPLSQLLG